MVFWKQNYVFTKFSHSKTWKTKIFWRYSLDTTLYDKAWMFPLEIQSPSPDCIPGHPHVTKTLHSPGHLPLRSSVLYKQTDMEQISWKPSRCPTICSLPPTWIALSPCKIILKNERPCLLVWGIQPKAWRERHLPAPALSTHNSHRRRVINSLPRGNAKRSCNDNDPPSMELLLLGTMELPWYLSLAGNIGIKWAWAQLCVNDIYKQIRFVYLYWMQTH